MKRYLITAIILFASVSIFLPSCNSTKKADPTAKETESLPDDVVELRDDQKTLANIELGQVKYRSLSGNIKVNGIVSAAPQDLATVCMPFGGFVRNISLIPGQSVRKGQTLAIIENQDFVDIQQNYLEARNKLDYAEAEYKRHSELYKDDVYSEKNLQQVTTDYKNLQAEVRALEEKLHMIGITPSNLREDNISSVVSLVSPIDGFVKTVNVNLGKNVASSDVLFEIMNSDNLLLELTLFDKDASKVSEGQKIRFFINNETEQHNAIIYQTGKSINNDKTYKVFANVTSSCENIMPGMYVNGVIETSGNKVASLPDEAIVSFDDKDYIFVYKGSKQENGRPFTEYRMIEIHKGFSDNGYTEVMLPDGFDLTGSKVVVKGAYNLLSAKKNAGEMAC